MEEIIKKYKLKGDDKLISDKELKNISGGFSLGVGLLIGGLISFFIGVVDGYVRPLPCR